MKLVRLLAALGLTAALLGGCGGQAHGSGKPTVVASFYPLEYVARRIVGAHATVVDLTRPGVEPHDLEMTVQQTMDIVDAKAVLYEHGFQPAVDQAVEQNGPKHVVDAARVVRIERGNPHFWQDPLRLAAVARAFTRTMAEVDPTHARDYRAHLATLREDLRRLDRDYRSGLRHCAVHTVVVSHEAFGYLSKFGLRFVPVTGLSPGAEPSPSRMAQIQQVVRRKGVTTVFAEPLASPELVDTLAHDLGVQVATLDPIEGLSTATKHDDYLSLMRANLAALQKANRCR